MIGHTHREMLRAIADIPKEGLVCLDRAVDEFEGSISLIVRLISRGIIRLPAVVIGDGRAVIMAPVERDRVVKAKGALWRYKAGVGATFETPFADVAGLLPRVLEVFGKKSLSAPQREMVLDHPVILRIFARQNGAPERPENGMVGAGLLKIHTPSRQPVDVGLADHRIASAAHSVIAHLVGEDRQANGSIEKLGNRAVRDGQRRAQSVSRMGPGTKPMESGAMECPRLRTMYGMNSVRARRPMKQSIQQTPLRRWAATQS